MCEFPIYIRDLNPEVQLELLSFLEFDSAKAGNLDEFPVVSIPKPLLDEHKDNQRMAVCCRNCGRSDCQGKSIIPDLGDGCTKFKK